jgi:hypothetical protein
MGLHWLVFLIGPVNLIDMWFGEDQRANIIKHTCLKEIALRFHVLWTFSCLKSREREKEREREREILIKVAN